jgi:UDP-N-acetyl-D-mannosaminuronate dehydrogenase
MAGADSVVVLGMGEVGQPLFRILSRRFPCVAVDVDPVELHVSCSVMHVCYPFQIDDFVGTTVRYITKYRPALTIIHASVAPGTTGNIHEASGKSALAYSPVRGKHTKMEKDLLRYRKFVAGCDQESTHLAQRHLEEAGFRTDAFRTPEVAELAKLLETTGLGMLIAWAQEVERLALRHGASFSEVNAFIEEIDFLPSHVFPGHIGGHCVMPNIAILRTRFRSSFLDAIVDSNEEKGKQLQPASVGERT